MKGGIGWKLTTLALDHDLWKLYMMFLSREVNIKMCQIYTKIHIYTILYRNSRFKQIIFSKSATNLKTKISQRNPILTKVFSNYYSIILIFIFNRYHWWYYLWVLITSQEFPPMKVQYTGHMIQTETRDHYTAL